MTRLESFIFQVKVGSSFVFLYGDKSVCMLKECNLPNVVTDAMVFHYTNTNNSHTDAQWTNTSIAIQNSNSIPASIYPTEQGISTGRCFNTRKRCSLLVVCPIGAWNVPRYMHTVIFREFMIITPLNGVKILDTG